MNKNIELFGEKYYLDIENIVKWCLNSTNNPFKESEINEGYDIDENGDLQMISKVVRETKVNLMQDDTIRYDLIKTLLLPFINGNIFNLEDININFSYNVLINTLLEKGFLVKI